jgi:hypothetical protein
MADFNRRRRWRGPALGGRLQLNWGVVDVDDCVAGARFLAAQGRVDSKRCELAFYAIEVFGTGLTF